MGMKTVSFKMNLPLDVKDWFTAEAKRNFRSLSGEIISVLNEKMELQKEKAAEVEFGDLPSAALSKPVKETENE